MVIGLGIGGAGSLEEPERDGSGTSASATNLRRSKLDARAKRLDNRATKIAAQENLLDERKEELDRREEAVAQQPEAPEPVTFGEGTLIVGQDVAPGTYRAYGTETCYWARLKALGGSLDDIVANHVGGGAQTVEIAPTDTAFESSGCGTWSPV
ncbi:MAG: hypothetical protein ABR529_04025 [Actinomycetota bacterium]